MNDELLVLVKNIFVDTELIKKLLKTHHGINERDEYGRTVLFYSANEEIAELLINHGANFMLKDFDGKNAREYNTNVDFVVRNKCFEKRRSNYGPFIGNIPKFLTIPLGGDKTTDNQKLPQ
jgi:hypothetical protein